MNVLLGITGGIAAYKAPDLVRRLRERGADVQVVMTASAEEFVRAIAVGSIMRRTGTQFSEETLDLLTADVAAEMKSYIGDSGLIFPMEAHLLTAMK